MPVAKTVTDYLQDKGVAYGLRKHPRSATSVQSAISAEIPISSVAKAVAFGSEQGRLLAVLPADHDVDMHCLQDEVGRDLQMLEETDLVELFPDCEIGAVPAIGPAYGLETVVDTRLQNLEEVYFEAGDHEELVHVTEADFEKLEQGASFVHFSRQLI